MSAKILFDSLGLDAKILTALAELQYTTPTPVQKASIPILLQNDNLLSIPVYLEVCFYKDVFVYGVIALRGIYGFPLNPIGEPMIPIRVVDWRAFRTDLDGKYNSSEWNKDCCYARSSEL